jgi:hypothetical protein
VPLIHLLLLLTDVEVLSPATVRRWGLLLLVAVLLLHGVQLPAWLAVGCLQLSNQAGSCRRLE